MRIQMSQKGSIFGTRPMAHGVFDDVQSDRVFILDFSGVQMASSSFLHETLLILRNKSTEIQMENMSEAIELQYAKAKRALGISTL